MEALRGGKSFRTIFLRGLRRDGIPYGVKPLRLLVLASGRGSHAVNLIQASRDGRLLAEVVRVLSDQIGAPVLEKSRALGVPSAVLEPVGPGVRLIPGAELELIDRLATDRIGLVALCGFMKLLSADFLGRVSIPILNVHPSLLPAFPGLHAQRQAIEAGVRVTGATVHFVDAGIDSGPILLQAPLDVLPEDTPESLSERLLPVEQRLYVEAIRLIQRGAVQKEGRRVRVGSGVETNRTAAQTGRRT